jgi:hypothetical protein
MAGRLIAVEGLPGSGKSSLSQALAVASKENRNDVRWYSELEVNHPLACIYEAERDRTVDGYVSRCGEIWRRSLRSHEEGETAVIVEAWLLQGPIFGLLLANMDPLEIIEGMCRLHAHLEKAIFVYLTQHDVPAAVDHFCASRGETMRAFYISRNDVSPFARARGVSGFDGLVRFWTDHRDICDAVLERVAHPRVVQDVSDYEWKGITNQVIAKLGLQPVDTARWSFDLDPFAGRYRLDADRTFDLVVEQGKLFAMSFPFFWREVETELVPDGVDSFFVRSWPTVGSFEMSEGYARSVTFESLLMRVSRRGPAESIEE